MWSGYDDSIRFMMSFYAEENPPTLHYYTQDVASMSAEAGHSIIL